MDIANKYDNTGLIECSKQGFCAPVKEWMKEDLDYTFIVTTYNQHDLIVQTLESIKYQIITYGTDFSIQLIISDDGSTDNNVEIINKWLALNGQYFSRIDRIFEEINHGTCHSFCSALENVKGKYFKEIAGDDILPENNVFEVMNKLANNDIVTGVGLKFDNGVIIQDRTFYKTEIRQAFFKYKEVKSLAKFSVPIKGGAIWSKKLITEKVLNYVRQYRLVEDRPFWYKVTQDNEELTYYFDNSVMLLYRGGGGSSPDSKVHKIHLDDLKKFYNDVRRQNTTLYDRESIFCLKYGLDYINLSIIKVKIKDFIYRKHMKDLWKEVFLPNIKKNQKHLSYIMAQSEIFLKMEKCNEQEKASH